MKCTKCQELIQEGRLKALPEATTCVECSTTSAWYLRNILAGKTEYMETEIIKDPKQAEVLREMDKQRGSIDQHIEAALLFNPLADDYDPKFPHLHSSDDGIEMLDSMIEYFIETEEYEKCAELVKYKEKIYGKTRKTTSCTS